MRVVSERRGVTGLIHRIAVCDACGWQGSPLLLISEALFEVDSHACLSLA